MFYKAIFSQKKGQFHTTVAIFFCLLSPIIKGQPKTSHQLGGENIKL